MLGVDGGPCGCEQREILACCGAARVQHERRREIQRPELSRRQGSRVGESRSYAVWDHVRPSHAEQLPHLRGRELRRADHAQSIARAARRPARKRSLIREPQGWEVVHRNHLPTRRRRTPKVQSMYEVCVASDQYQGAACRPIGRCPHAPGGRRRPDERGARRGAILHSATAHWSAQWRRRAAANSISCTCWPIAADDARPTRHRVFIPSTIALYACARQVAVSNKGVASRSFAE